MGSNAGTGWPLTLRCSKCRVRRDWNTEMWKGTKLVRTGRKKPSRKKGGVRGLPELHEYRCLSCGHVGWSRHQGVLLKPLEEKEGS